MLLKSSPIFTLQAPANATPTFTANILPVRAQAAYPVNASSRYWNSESMAQSTDVPANGPLGTGKQQETGTEDLEGENEGVEKTAKMAKSGYENEGLKISYFRGRRLLGREIGLGEMGYKGKEAIFHPVSSLPIQTIPKEVALAKLDDVVSFSKAVMLIVLLSP